MSLMQKEQLYQIDEWGTKSEYKRKRQKVSFAAMDREIGRGKIAVKLDVIDMKIKMNFSQADMIFGFVDLEARPEKSDLFA